MPTEYTKEQKDKYCAGFKKCTLTLSEYAEKMKICAEDLKRWLKEYKEPLPYGAIDIAKLIGKEQETVSNKSYIKFDTKAIKIEIAQNYDKELLKKLSEVLAVMSKC